MEGGDGGHRHSTWIVAPWLDLTGGIGFDVPGHHWARVDYGQDKLEASSMEGSEGAATARW